MNGYGLEDFADLPEQWDKIGGPNSSFVNRLISVKRFHNGYPPIPKKDACSFLTELCDWIKKINTNNNHF